MSSDPGPDEVYCIECGEIIRERAEICPECGVRQPTASGGQPSAGAGAQRGQPPGGAGAQRGQPGGAAGRNQGRQPAPGGPNQGGQPPRGAGRARPTGDPSASEAFKLMLAYYQQNSLRGFIHALVALFTAGGWALWFVFFWFGTFVGWKDVEGMRDIRYRT